MHQCVGAAEGPVSDTNYWLHRSEATSSSGTHADLGHQGRSKFAEIPFQYATSETFAPGQSRKDHYARYREDLVTQAGVCIFISGLKDDGGHRVTAEGVVAEFEVVAAAKRVPHPGGGNRRRRRRNMAPVKMDYERYCGKLSKRLFNALNDTAASPDRIAKSVEEILAWLKENETSNH